MFVRCKKRFKDGKEHRYWSVVENVRVRGGRVVQRQVLYLGEINDSQRAAWCRSIKVMEGKSRSRQMALFPEDREAPALNCEVVKINVAEVALHEPRQWGACWLALAYEVMPGNTADNTTLAEFLEKIERQYGRSDRIWIMDRGIPTEETLVSMREGDAPVRYLVGTPKGRLTRLEKVFLDLPWQEVRQSVNVKLLVEDGELYVLVHSEGRQLKERGMRRRRLKKLWRRLGELQGQSNSRDQLMLKLGAAKKEAGRAWNLVDIRVPETDKELAANGFSFHLRRDRLRRVRRREGRYLLRSNMVAEDPATLWRLYMQLIEIEQAFKELKHDLAIRPIFHQREERIEAHIFVSFIAYCLLVDAEEPRPAARLGSHPARHHRGLRHHPDGRCASSNHRRPAPRPAATHPAEQGARATAAPARHGPAATARAADLRLTVLEPPPPFGAL